MKKDRYRITIMADNILEGEIELTDDEISTFYKIVDAIKPDGKYIPTIIVENLSAIDRKIKAEQEQEELEKKKHDEEFKEECSHLGKYSIASKYPTLAKLLAERGF